MIETLDNFPDHHALSHHIAVLLPKDRQTGFPKLIGEYLAKVVVLLSEELISAGVSGNKNKLAENIFQESINSLKERV